MSNESLVIHSINKLGCIIPPTKQILTDISLGFYYGAKIGVLGPPTQASPRPVIKTSVDKDYIGEISMSRNYTVDRLEQESKPDGTEVGAHPYRRETRIQTPEGPQS